MAENERSVLDRQRRRHEHPCTVSRAGGSCLFYDEHIPNEKVWSGSFASNVPFELDRHPTKNSELKMNFLVSFSLTNISLPLFSDLVCLGSDGCFSQEFDSPGKRYAIESTVSSPQKSTHRDRKI